MSNLRPTRDKGRPVRSTLTRVAPGTSAIGTFKVLGTVSIWNVRHRDKVNGKRILRQARPRHGFAAVSVDPEHPLQVATVEFIGPAATLFISR